MASVNNIVNPFLAPSIVPLPHNVKDSRWLTLEVCREYQRNKCSRTENECKFAHPPPHVEVQNGRVVCCFDSLKGKCQRRDPPCKYLHPPNHLREFLMQNGRNNLIMKNLQMQFLQNSIFAPNSASGVIPISPYIHAPPPGATPGATPGSAAGHPAAHAAHPYHQLLGGAGLPASTLIAASHDPANLMNASMAAAMAGLPTAAQGAMNGVNGVNSLNGVVVSSTAATAHLNGSSPTITSIAASATPSCPVTVSKTTTRPSDARLDGVGLPTGAYPGLTAKRPAVADSKSGLPVYQPAGITNAAAAAAAAAYHGLTTMQLPTGQQAFIPTMPTSTFVGHTASLPRF